MMFPVRVLVVAMAMAASAPPVSAHHALTMYDRETERSVQGVVREFQWTNPHSWIQLMTVENGMATPFNVETSSPGVLTRYGWSAGALKAGDRVTVVVHPLKSGDPGGLMVRVVAPDGKTLSRAGPPVPPR